MSGRHGNLTDEELMTLCREGDGRALEVLFGRFQQPIYNFCLRFLRDPGRAEDVLQETFLRLYSNRGNWEPEARFASWAFRIARNLCVDEVRRYWNRQVFPESQLALEGEVADFLDNQVGPAVDPRDSLDQEKIGRIIEEAVGRLSEEQREVVILSKYHGLSYPEIAEILSVSPESVKQRAYRAHLRLREILEPVLLRK
ncbi:sigma-70 family RNA polymerase sigma factor [bacterium]|nr:sigma-70 family RNA polymerase sigma factor [bacterium]